MTKNALNSLYGEGHAQATDEGKGIRNQEVLTPQGIVDGLLKFWPEGILYDAAGDEGEPLNQMEDYLRECEIREAHRTFNKQRKKNGVHPLPLVFPDGLPVKPKAGLKDWLKMQLTKSEGESIMLVPFPLVLGLRVIGRDFYKTAARKGAFYDAFAHVGDPV